jgi:hypothetical protein
LTVFFKRSRRVISLAIAASRKGDCPENETTC